MSRLSPHYYQAVKKEVMSSAKWTGKTGECSHSGVEGLPLPELQTAIGRRLQLTTSIQRVCNVTATKHYCTA
jgi:hypothetical protein